MESKKVLHLPNIQHLNAISTINSDSSEGIKMPLSVTNRVTRIRNNMHQMRLRQAKEKLHNEIHQTMKMYSSEKHQLLKQLANLRHDLTDLKLPEIASRTFDPYQTPRIEPTHYVHEKRKSQNDKKKLTSSKGSVVRCDDTSDYESDYEKSVSDTDQTIFGDNYDLYHDDKTDSFSHDDKSVSDLHSDGLGGHLNTQWYSGKYLRHSSLDRTSKSHSVQFKHDTPIYPEIFENEIPVIEVQDRQRCEIKLPTIKGINKKKVKFDGKTDVKLISPEQKMNLSRSNKTACNSQQRKWRPDRLTGIGDWKMKQAARGQMKGRNSPPGVSFPPIRCHREKKSLEAIPETLAESAEWKTLYLNIHDDDKRNKTLLDILHAVRIRMQTNERSLRFGEQRSSDKTDNILCDYLLGSHTRKERLQRGPIPSHSMERCFRRSNAVQLQNYLHKRSRQRRMIEHLDSEKYPLTHRVAHKHLQDVLPM